MDRKVGESIREVKGKVHAKTGVSSAGFKQKNEDRSRCIRLCDRRGIVNGSVKTIESRLCFFLFSFSFLFSCLFYFSPFLFLELWG